MTPFISVSSKCMIEHYNTQAAYPWRGLCGRLEVFEYLSYIALYRNLLSYSRTLLLSNTHYLNVFNSATDALRVGIHPPVISVVSTSDDPLTPAAPLHLLLSTNIDLLTKSLNWPFIARITKINLIYKHMSKSQRSAYILCVNPVGVEGSRPPILGRVFGGSWTGREILLYFIMYRKYVRKWWLLKRNKIIFSEV